MKKAVVLAKTASLLLALGVLLGAFGSHGLSHAITKAPIWWQMATFYWFVHAIALLLLSVLVALKLASGRPAYLFLGGMALFCGSLYAMALGASTRLGAITPIGGLLFSTGWLWLCFDIKASQ